MRIGLRLYGVHSRRQCVLGGSLGCEAESALTHSLGPRTRADELTNKGLVQIRGLDCRDERFQLPMTPLEFDRHELSARDRVRTATTHTPFDTRRVRENCKNEDRRNHKNSHKV